MKSAVENSRKSLIGVAAMHGNHKRFHLGIFGGSGCGKTSFAIRFLANSRAKCVFIFDPDGQFAESLSIEPVTLPGEFQAAVSRGWVCFDPHTMFPGELENALTFFSDFAFQASDRIPGRKFFVVDELGMYVTGQAVPRPLKIIVQTGRRRGLDGVFIAQQPNELHNTIRSQLSEVVCFQLTDDTALEFPRKFGFDPEEIRGLPPFKWICRNNQRREARG